MPEDSFDTNLLRMISAELYFIAGMQASREMYGKGYFALGVAEKAAVDQAVLAGISSNYGVISPELLRQQKGQQGVGFQGPGGAPSAGKG